MIHKTFVRVDEIGTEAAAVTHVGNVALSAHRPPELRVDRPFLFFIRNRRTADLLFAGRVLNPSGERRAATSNPPSAPSAGQVSFPDTPKTKPRDLTEWFRQLHGAY